MELRQASLDSLADQCREQTERYRRGEASLEVFCLELLRRSLVERDELAWAALFVQYRGIVLAWIRRHPASASLDEEDDYWVNLTFERFWRSIGSDRFYLFPGLSALLSYLKTCAHSVLLDEARARARDRVATRAEADADSDDPPDVEAHAMAALSAEDLWAIIARELQDESERLVVRLSFALDLKPQEIQRLHPEHFSSTGEVYRVKRNVLDRLRRSKEIRELVGPMD